MTTAHPWTAYAVKWPPPKRGFNNGCLTFENVTHVAHIKDAVRIVEDRKLRAGLVYDASRLNTERVTVCWLSPKEWIDGYIYGHIAFQFHWQDLVEDKKLYWVEDHKTKEQRICRILLSEKTYEGVHFDEYSPHEIGGPVYHHGDSDNWYHNNLVTTEFMVDDDIPLSAVQRIQFVDHHPQWCAKHKWTTNCPDRKTGRDLAGALFLSFIIGTSRTNIRDLFATEVSPKKVHAPVVSALDHLCRRLLKTPSIGSNPVAEADWYNLICAALMAVWNGLDEQRAAILSVFDKSESVEAAFWHVVESYFEGITVDRD